MTKSVLTKDLQKKQILDEFLKPLRTKTSRSTQKNDPISFASGSKKPD